MLTVSRLYTHFYWKCCEGKSSRKINFIRTTMLKSFSRYISVSAKISFFREPFLKGLTESYQWASAVRLFVNPSGKLYPRTSWWTVIVKHFLKLNIFIDAITSSNKIKIMLTTQFHNSDVCKYKHSIQIHYLTLTIFVTHVQNPQCAS